ncbi:hypothetical protein GVN16_03750 [Emticicia sp. CRIBPO]|uniref:hypothetical protein n=1 Tax=Emticicia sp. CRIBPO TaxID=2683258 RepID=UPI001412AA10|nr:hypothetical protein [Emticicia sp. CRIBPO]NBA84856.1 hypothetical protein [Emticicia sp. CRIBPO]
MKKTVFILLLFLPLIHLFGQSKEALKGEIDILREENRKLKSRLDSYMLKDGNYESQLRLKDMEIQKLITKNQSDLAALQELTQNCKKYVGYSQSLESQILDLRKLLLANKISLPSNNENLGLEYFNSNYEEKKTVIPNTDHNRTYSNSLNGTSNGGSNYKETSGSAKSSYSPRVPASSRTYIRGPKGGCYYLSSGGNKEYVDRSLCQ